MDIRHVDLTGAKNVDLTNQAIIDSFESMSCLEYSNIGCKKLAVIINATQKTQDAIDNRFDVIQRYTGVAPEKFRHIQNDGIEEYMDIIIAGLPYPEECIRDLSKKYSTIKDKVTTEAKALSDIFEDIDFDDDIEETNIQKMRNPEDALAIFNLDDDSDAAIASEPYVKPAKRANTIENY